MALAVAVATTLLLLQFVRRRRAARAAGAVQAIDAGLGQTVDLVAVVIGGGGTVRQAIETVARFGPEPVASSFNSVLARTSARPVESTVGARSITSASGSSAGLLLADAIAPLSDELGRSFHPLVGALLATERDGAPVSLLLQRLADDAEQARRWRIEALTKRLPVTLLVPLVVCLLPATVVGALVPLAVIALRELNV